MVNHYPNGRILYKGKVLTCPDYSERYPCYNSTCRKIGEWVYYYQNGRVKQIENYLRVKDCSSDELPDGTWKYFNESGILVKQEEYKEGLLWTADVARFYHHDQLAGEILVRNGIRDTIWHIEENRMNFVLNGDFKVYFGPPQQITGDGQDEIGQQIPFWFSNNRNTPDYYNPYRRFKNIPDNMDHATNENYDYVGVILYHHPTKRYSEYITGNIFPHLEPGKKYCLNIRIRLSQNSGFFIDQFGGYFSDTIPSPGLVSPQVSFNQKLNNRNEWKTLCAFYTATGNERYITLGSNGNLKMATIMPIVPVNMSEGDYNQSAYYIIDQVKLSADTTDCSCEIEDVAVQFTERINFDLMNPADSFMCNKVFVLKNIFFEFDQSDLLPASFEELEKLHIFLNTNDVSIMISGHTDHIGTPDYNKALSLARANAVSEWLIKKGIDKNRIQTEGFGADLPLVENDTETHRAINRRVEFAIKRN
ncbi:MAG: OmpA family protein [Bacteroidales bacterium]|nr:OmpA family protein [Bacteroidales bacterium]